MGSEFFRSWISSTMCTSPANTTDLCTIPLSEDETGEIWVVQTKSNQKNDVSLLVVLQYPVFTNFSENVHSMLFILKFKNKKYK